MKSQEDCQVPKRKKKKEVPKKNVSDIAREIRGYLKKNFKGFKFSVRTSRYPMGKALNIMIKDVPDNFGLYSQYYEDCLRQEKKFYDIYTYPVYSDEASMLLKFVENHVKKYNTDEIKVMPERANRILHSIICYDETLKRSTERKIKTACAC